MNADEKRCVAPEREHPGEGDARASHSTAEPSATEPDPDAAEQADPEREGDAQQGEGLLAPDTAANTDAGGEELGAADARSPAAFDGAAPLVPSEGGALEDAGVSDAAALPNRPVRRSELMSASARDVAVGANGQVWIVGNEVRTFGFSLHRLQGTVWQEVASDGADRVVVDAAGMPWIVQNDGKILRGVAGSAGIEWRQFPGECALDLAIGGADQDIWMTRCGDGRVFSWDGLSWRDRGRYANSIAVGPNGTVWMIDGGERVFNYSPATGRWEFRHGTGARYVALSPSGKVYVLSDEFAANGLVAKALNIHEAWVPMGRGAIGVRIAAGNDDVWLANNMLELYRFVEPSP